MGYLKLWCVGGTRNLTEPCAQVEGEYSSFVFAIEALAKLPRFSGIERAEWQENGYGTIGKAVPLPR